MGGRYYEDIRNVNEILRNTGKQRAQREVFIRNGDLNAEGGTRIVLALNEPGF
jgi:hypothetical protein